MTAVVSSVRSDSNAACAWAISCWREPMKGAQRRFEHVRDGVLLGRGGRVAPARSPPVLRQHLRSPPCRSRCSPRRLRRSAVSDWSACVHLVEQIAERLLRVDDLDVELVVVGEQRHRPVVALGGDRVEHLLGPAGLLLEPVEVVHPLVHPADDDQAQDRQADEQQGAGEEAESSFRWMLASIRATASTSGRSQPVRRGSLGLSERHSGTAPVKRLGVCTRHPAPGKRLPADTLPRPEG